MRGLVFAIFGAALCMASVVGAQGNRQSAPFGVLSELDGTAWAISDDPESIARYKWKSAEEVLEVLIVTEAEMNTLEYRLGLDGRSVTVEILAEPGRRQVTFPSPDSWSYTDLKGNFLTGCRLKTDRKSMFCEGIGQDGKIANFQRVKVPLAAFDTALAAIGEAANGSLASAREKETLPRAQWGLLWDLSGKDYAMVRKCGNDRSVEVAASFRYAIDRDTRKPTIVENQMASAERVFTGALRYYWQYDPATDTISRLLFANQPRPMSRTADKVFGLNKDWRGGGKFYELRRAASGSFVIERYDERPDGSRIIRCLETLVEKPRGHYVTYNNAQNAIYYERERAKKSGPGFLEALAGGLAEVAAATSPDYNPYAGLTGQTVENPLDENSAQNRQFRENIARIAGGQQLVTTPAAPNSPFQAGSVGTTGSSASLPGASQAPVMARESPFRPFRFYLTVVPSVKESDSSQPLCVSSIITAPAPPTWRDGEATNEDAYPNARSYMGDFVQRCATARGDQRVVSTTTVEVVSNFQGDARLQQEYSGRMGQSDVWKIGM